MVTLSSFEKLPRELVWKVFEFVPEAVLNLRLTCRTIQSYVDEYGNQPATFPIVDQLFIFGSRGCKPPNFLQFELSMTKNKSNLFVLRMRLRKSPIKWITRTEYEFSDKIEYTVKMSAEEDHQNIIDFLGECVGGRVGKVAINCEEDKFSIASDLLKKIEFGSFHVTSQGLSNDAVRRILEVLSSPKVGEFSLWVGNSSVTDPADFLLKLSNLVRSIELRQQGTIEIANNRSRPLLVLNVEWAVIIMDMFSRKMDKLRIDNLVNPDYLSRQNIDTLRKRLTRMQKRIWFETSCVQYDEELDYTDNYHDVKIFDKKLTIQHRSLVRRD